MMCDPKCARPQEFEAFLIPALYGTVFIVGLIGNLAGMLVIVQYIKHQNVLGIYVANLCISDFLYICTLPLWTVYTANHDHWELGKVACQVVGFIFNTNIYTTIAFLSCIAVDRFMATVYPLHSRIVRTMKTATTVSIIVWLIILGSHSVLLTHPELFNSSYNVNICYESYPMEKWVVHLNYFRVFGVFLIPSLMFLFSYGAVIRAVHRSGLEDIQKRKITGLLLITTAIFVVNFLPYHVALFVRSYLNHCSETSCDIERKLHSVYRVAFALTSINSALDPIITIFVSDSVKQDILEGLNTFQLWCTNLYSCNQQKSVTRLGVKRIAGRQERSDFAETETIL
ncbi:G-protein coupled receptor 4-like [Latimeria chalumnae]|uniref:G-protein coupled receptor 4-like n=1 Tax=Latimeria chalumnae TaxID=7897 RepID=UPI0003C15231|nr:PREDICTED: G-protein coupled receptor 4-like [Latimeria chalumnae]|eukprot:XP_005991696.1 PREDICTED: G-protein coupled receptor 4-like [Latimeria chalumnae]